MDSLQGHFLVASHRLRDPNFARTVTLMVQHHDEGALGVVLNRPSETPISAVWRRLSETPCPFEDFVLHGGPCPGRLMALHGHDRAADLEVAAGVHFSADPGHLEWLMRHGEGPARFVLGYAGWAAGQLEDEFESGSWLVAPATREAVFDAGTSLWARLTGRRLRELGLPPLDPDSLPVDPSVN